LAGRGGDWRAALLDCLLPLGYRRADLTLVGQDRWFRQWLESADGALEGAVAGFGRPDTGPEQRFAAFADAAAAAVDAGRIPEDAPAVMAFGSLLNFAVDPERLPFILRRPFSALEQLMSEPTRQDGSLVAEYGHHLRFAGAVEDALRPSGLAADMLDVQALVFSAARNAAFWATERGVAIDAPPPRRETPHYLAICAIYKDEAPYLHEWIEFHRLVGVERFFLYDNRSVDDHAEVLAPYVERGEVVIHAVADHDWPKEVPQRAAYQHCIAEHADEARWIAFIDLDEFLFAHDGRPLPEHLRDYEPWPGVGVNWAVFGPSGHVTRPAGPVIESYVNRIETGENRCIKNVVDPARVTPDGAALHKFTYTELGAVDENRYPIGEGYTKTVSRTRLQLNHYMTKSLEEWRVRSMRARPALERRKGTPLRRPFNPEVMEARERLGVRDEAILRYVPALKEALSRRP